MRPGWANVWLEVAATGNAADAGGALHCGSDGSTLSPSALEAPGEASGRAGSRPLLSGGALREVTGYVPTLTPTIAATTAANFDTDPPRAPAKHEHAISRVSH
jgi:hypothetical protein